MIDSVIEDDTPSARMAYVAYEPSYLHSTGRHTDSNPVRYSDVGRQCICFGLLPSIKGLF